MNHCEHDTILLFEEVYFDSPTPFVENPRAFASLDTAKQYMTKLIEEERTWNRRSDKDDCADAHRRYVIRMFLIDNNVYPQECIHAWEFSINGKLLREEPEKGRSARPFTFAIGDIVEVLPRLIEPSSPVFENVYGTVVAMNDDQGHPCYQLFTIHEEGYLTAMSVHSHCLRLAEDTLPKRLLFLRIYSEHLRGIHPLPDSALQFIRPGDPSVLVANTVTFDFENKCVRQPYE